MSFPLSSLDGFGSQPTENPSEMAVRLVELTESAIVGSLRITLGSRWLGLRPSTRRVT